MEAPFLFLLFVAVLLKSTKPQSECQLPHYTLNTFLKWLVGGDADYEAHIKSQTDGICYSELSKEMDVNKIVDMDMRLAVAIQTLHDNLINFRNYKRNLKSLLSETSYMGKNINDYLKYDKTAEKDPQLTKYIRYSHKFTSWFTLAVAPSFLEDTKYMNSTISRLLSACRNMKSYMTDPANADKNMQHVPDMVEMFSTVEFIVTNKPGPEVTAKIADSINKLKSFTGPPTDFIYKYVHPLIPTLYDNLYRAAVILNT